MKSFSITQVLVYNPKLKSMKKKPIESDIQQAKIMAYFPSESPIQQKCNTVGMAEGVFQFSRALMTQIEQQAQNKNDKQMVIFLDNCALVWKQFEPDIWLFLKLQYQQLQTYYRKYGEAQSEGDNQQEDEDSYKKQNEQFKYIDNILTEKMAYTIIQHFYFSFRTFYGRFEAYCPGQITNHTLSELDFLLNSFSYTYHEINKLEETKRLDISSYLFQSIRALPLDVNSTLKFGYFKNVMENYDQNMKELIVFSNGLLAYSSLPKQYTSFFSRYFFGTGEPYRFDGSIVVKKMKILQNIQDLATNQKYGSVYNNYRVGFGNVPGSASSVLDTRSSVATGQVPKRQTQDLLGLSQISMFEHFPKVHIFLPSQMAINKQQSSQYKIQTEQENIYIMSCYLQRKMLFVTFYKALTSAEQLIFQNRFYHDNIDKFIFKITEIMNGVLAQTDSYKFIYSNLSTLTGKMGTNNDKWCMCTTNNNTISLTGGIAMQLRYIWEQLMQGSKDGVTATTYKDHWVYGIHRLNRLLIIFVPNDVPVHRLQDYAAKMSKQYFFKAYM